MTDITLHHGDSRDVLKTLADNSIDSVVTDPPYALVSVQKRFGKAGSAPAQFGSDGAYARASAGFMGKSWDTGETAFAVEFWTDVWRVLKPGGHVAAFGGTRSYGQLQIAIEAAGFEVRDSILDMVASDDPVRLFLESLTDEQARAFLRCVEDSQFGGLLGWVYGTGFPKSRDSWKTEMRAKVEAQLRDQGVRGPIQWK